MDLPKKERSCPRGFADRVSERSCLGEARCHLGLLSARTQGRSSKQTNDACGAFSDLLGRSWHKCTVDVDGEILVVWRWRQFCNLPISAGEWQGSVCVTCALRAIFGLWPSPVHISIYLPNIDSSVPASVRGGLTFGPGGLDFCQHFDRSKSLAPGG